MESEEYMNRKSTKQRGEAEVSILIITIIITIIIINNLEQKAEKRHEPCNRHPNLAHK